jgi:tRNA nucleotidyltransferase/poly(A) polymerase
MQDFFNGPIGEALKKVVDQIWSLGYDAYLAGGCVRDHLLSRPFKDIDIATNAKPDELIKIFPNHIPVGKQFGIIIVIMDQYKFEVATFRSDGDYLDGRHPQGIIFSSAEEDAQRRDFSINALFFDLKSNEVIDYVGGIIDLNAKLIRAVGDPRKRFSEDYLRILRALRFRVQLKFEIELQTWWALLNEMKNIMTISGERIADELFKGLAADPQMMSDILQSSGAWHVLFPYLGKRNQEQASKLQNIKSSIQSKGEAFALLLLQTEVQAIKDAFDCESNQKIKWNLEYEQIVKKINDHLKLSREDLKILKYLGASCCWIKNWKNLRPAFSYELLAMFEDKILADLLIAFGLDSSIIAKDMSFAKNQPKSFLTGSDVEKLDPKQRGGVLKESFYLQWEQKLCDRNEALEWLTDNYLKLKMES